MRFAATKVGDRYVLEKMRLEGYNLGGEQSGHVIFLHHSTTGDGELTAGKLLKLLAAKKPQGIRMSDLNAVYTKFPQVLINIEMNDEQKRAYREDEYIAGFVESQQQSLMGSGRVLVRLSGTEPKVRVMVEGEDMAAITQSAERIAEMIRKRILKENQ